MDPVVVAGVVGGAFALGGVVLGGAMNYLTARGAERRAAAGKLNEAYLALVEPCLRVRVETGLLQKLLSDAAAGRELAPVAQREAAEVLEAMTPLSYEVMNSAARLGVLGGGEVETAALGVALGARSLIRSVDGGEAYAAQGVAFEGALRALRAALDAAVASRWKRWRWRRAIGP